jgi:hypothetical protein
MNGPRELPVAEPGGVGSGDASPCVLSDAKLTRRDVRVTVLDLKDSRLGKHSEGTR